MKIVGYFQIEESSVYHVVYEVTVPGSRPEGFPKAWTLCGLKPRNRRGEVEILEEAPRLIPPKDPWKEDMRVMPHLCLNCQAVQDSGMIRIREFEAFLNRTPTRETHPQCFGSAETNEGG